MSIWITRYNAKQKLCPFQQQGEWGDRWCHAEDCLAWLDRESRIARDPADQEGYCQRLHAHVNADVRVSS